MQMQGKDTKVSVPSECAVIDVLARADGVIASHLKSSSTWSGLGVCVGCVWCRMWCRVCVLTVLLPGLSPNDPSNQTVLRH